MLKAKSEPRRPCGRVSGRTGASCITWTGFYAGLNAGAAFDSEFKSNQLAINDGPIHVNNGFGSLAVGRWATIISLPPRSCLALRPISRGRMSRSQVLLKVGLLPRHGSCSPNRKPVRM